MRVAFAAARAVTACPLREQLASCLPQLSARICFLTVDWYLPAVSKSLTVGAVPAEPAGTVN